MSTRDIVLCPLSITDFPAFLSTKLLSNMTSDTLASLIRDTIDDDRVTYDNVTQYDADFVNAFDEGTSHLSVIAPNGDAVAMTSTVNNGYFDLLLFRSLLTFSINHKKLSREI